MILVDSSVWIDYFRGTQTPQCERLDILEEVYDRFDTEPVAAGSVAQVHRAVLRVSGDEVAVKVLRPDVATRIQLDRALMLCVARLLERVFPSLRLVSLEAAVQDFCRAVEGQLDFVREAESAARMRMNFAHDLDLIIPRTFPEASSRAVLTMEWLDGLKEEGLAGSVADIHAVMRTCLRYIGRSIFVHSFLHADLHPGNLRFRPPGRVVAFDFGLMDEIADVDRVDFARLGFGMATGDGKAVAKIFYDRAARREVASYGAYEAEMSALIAEIQSRAIGEFPGVTVLARLFDILRRHRVQVGSQLTLIFVALMSAEGLGKRLAPDFIFFEELLPYIAEGLGLVPRSPSQKRSAPIAVPESATQPESFASGRYRSLRLLGEGTRKRVYLARDTNLDRDVALGFLKAANFDRVSLAGFQLEARAMAKLGDHPGIVAVYDFGVEEHGPYIVSEYMAGGTLAELLESREGRLVSIAETLRLVGQICRALAHAHELGVMHRDVKPGNVWLTADGLAKLGDFGLSTASDLLRPGEERALSGTIAYLCPEQALGKPADPRSDLYALGCVLYEMLTGEPPFTGSDFAAIISCHLDTPPIPPSAKNAEVSPALDALVLRCLAKRPADRPESAVALAEALSQIAGAAGAAQPTSLLDRLESGVFIGRDQEMKQLGAGLNEAFAGRGRLFLLAGEPGIGKTRMAAQLARDARRRGARVLVGRCYEGEGAPAFWPWLQILRSYVLEREPAALEAEMGASAADIAQLVPEVRERLPHVAVAMVQESGAARFRLFDAVTRFFKHAAAAQPLVLLLDDLHWADKSSLLLLQFLAHEMEQSRLLVAATYRDVEVLHGHPLAEVLPSLRRSHAHERMRLRGLAESDVRSLLGALGGHEMPPDLARAVHRETEGNPFFVEEILAHLVEEDMLRWDGKQWVADRQREEIGLPESVREVIGRRVARLSERCRQVLTLASVIGREFDVGVLEHVADLGHAEIATALGEATAARVVAAMPRAVGHLRFAHALIRETLYGELGTAERVLLHRRTGETLERVHGDAIEPHLAAIAHHFTEAAPGGDIEKAVSYAMRAAKTANAQLAFEEAARGYDQALKTLALRRPADELQRCRLLLELGEARFNGGEFERAKETFLRAAEIAEARDAPAELGQAALGYGGLALAVFEITQPTDRLVAMLEKSLAALSERGESGLRAQVMARLAVSLWNLEDRPRRLTLAREALAMAKRVGDHNTLGRVLLASTFVLWGPENLEERLRILDEATSPARAVTDPAVGFLLEAWRIWALIEAGDLTVGARLLARISQRPEAGRGYFRWMKSLMDASQAQFEGRFDDAERLTGEARLLGEDMRSRDSAILTAVQTVFLRWLQGRSDEQFSKFVSFVAGEGLSFRGDLTEAFLLLFTDAPDAHRKFAALTRRGFADIPRDFFWLAQIHWLAEAANHFQDAGCAQSLYDLLEPFAARGAQTFVVCLGSMSRPLGCLATLLGRFDAAARHFEEAIAANTRGHGRPWVAFTQYEYARMLSLRGRPGDREQARSLLAAAIDAARSIGMKKLLTDALALKLRIEGVGSADTKGSIDVVVSSLEQRRPDLRPHAAPDGTVTLLCSDIEGFSALTERLGDRRAFEIIGTHNAIVREQLRLHDGFEVELQGDGCLLAFSSAERGLSCAISLQQAFASYNAGPSEPIRVRIGLHTGEAIKEGDSFFGKTVLLAARIGAQARGGEIIVSSLVRQLLEGRDEFHFGRVRELEFTELAGRHVVSAVVWNGEPLDEPAEVEPVAGGDTTDASVFRKVGDFWTLSYDGKSFSMRDAKGLHYIARLLRHPGQEFHALDLVREVFSSGATEGGEGAAPRLGDAGEVVDPQAKAAYKARLDDLRAELEEAQKRNDAERAASLQEEIDFITQELSSAYGLGGRSRKAADAAERARKAVQSRVSESITRIRKEHPTLALHLSNNIRLGVFCGYTTEKVVDWVL